MKKLLCLCFAILLLCGCQQLQPDPTENTTEPVAQATTPSTEATQPSTEATTPSTAPTETEPTETTEQSEASYSRAEAKAYALPPIDLYPFVFSGSNPAVWLEMNTEDCVGGRLYIHDRRTNLLTPIGEDPVSVFASTKEHLYYVTNGRTLVETDYEGTSFTTLYQASRGDITYLYTLGKMIYLIEDGQNIVALDTETQCCETAMVQADVSTLFLFDTDKLIWYDSQRNPYYYNVTEQQSVALLDETAVDELIRPYYGS